MTRPASTRAQVHDRVIALLRRILPGFDAANLASGESIARALTPDSMDLLNFVMALHDEFGVDVPERDYAALDTVDACVDYVLAAMERASPSAAVRVSVSDAAMPPGGERHRLRDGRSVSIRPLGAGDAARERSFLAGLSEESRYQRFHQWVKAPSEALIHFLVDFDLARTHALVCTVPQEDGEAVVGEGRYVVDQTGEGCEFAVVIDDAWRHSGLAGLLLGELIESARLRGLRTMEGLVLANNVAMLRFARALGFRVTRLREDPSTVRVVKQL